MMVLSLTCMVDCSPEIVLMSPPVLSRSETSVSLTPCTATGRPLASGLAPASIWALTSAATLSACTIMSLILLANSPDSFMFVSTCHSFMSCSSSPDISIRSSVTAFVTAWTEASRCSAVILTVRWMRASRRALMICPVSVVFWSTQVSIFSLSSFVASTAPDWTAAFSTRLFSAAKRICTSFGSPASWAARLSASTRSFAPASKPGASLRGVRCGAAGAAA
mmetsp:Transcript_41557/g.123373  ORF Transcript_41557/g.123373 Transcript_41557/m.123373 type:complete len:222 (-) Transcript_41557:1072-1737(-)